MCNFVSHTERIAEAFKVFQKNNPKVNEYEGQQM
jgi:hypothetical protein